MASHNLTILVGNLTRDPEVKYLPSGTAICDISLAVNDREKKGDEWVDYSSFFDCVLFGRSAEVCGEYLSKGSNILVEGRLRQDRWEKDGQKRSKVKVMVSKMQMLGGKSNGAAQQTAEERQEAPPDDFSQDPDDEIQF